MMKLNPLVYSLCVIFVLSAHSRSAAQVQTKTYHESFKAHEGTVLDINTSHVDISFETWNRPEIDIEATIELKGATEEEAATYFGNRGIEILGNSEKVSIVTGSGNTWSFEHLSDKLSELNQQHFEFPEMNTFLWDIPEYPLVIEHFEMPPMPPAPELEFDFQSFKKDGDAYLEKWQKECEEVYGKEYKGKMEAWSKQMAEKVRKREKEREEWAERRSKQMQERAEQRAELMAQRAKERAQRQQELAERQARRMKDRQHTRSFYFSSDGGARNYEVKKSIKIKMPKNTKVKMNVRHGEVKLAENIRNLKADLSYATLWASTIDGDKTLIKASYSPVSVENWLYGRLDTNYSDNVVMEAVQNLDLNSTFSQVTIDKLLNRAQIDNRFGQVDILSVSNDFNGLEIELQNAELHGTLPVSFVVDYTGKASKFRCPSDWSVDRKKEGGLILIKAHDRKDSKKPITINSSYSEVVLNN